MLDTHTHLDRLSDPEDAIATARSCGISWMLTVGTGIESTERAIDLAQRHGEVAAAAGVHPNSAAEFDLAAWDELEALAGVDQVVAIGETGFDQFRGGGPTPAQQQELFERHCDLARRLDKALIIHTRAADELTLDGLETHAAGLRVVMHCFSMPDRLAEVLERGYFVSFAGNATYRPAEALRAAAAIVPGDRILLETDAPYLTPEPNRGKPNSPAHIADTYASLAQVRGTGIDALVAEVQETARSVFGSSNGAFG